MKKILLAGAILGATSTFALAADLPSRRAPPVYVPPILAPSFSWTGMYAGLNAGYAFNNHSDNNLAAANVAQQTAINVGNRIGFLRQSSNGFTGGGQIGYNYQLGGGLPVFGNIFGTGAGGFVIGGEADAAYTSLRNDFNSGLTANGNVSAYHSNVDFIGTVRGRVGYAFGDLFVFGTGGFAYGDVKKTDTFTGVANAYFGQGNTIRTGYAYGGGVEYAIPTASFLNFFKSSAVTVKVEYIHYNLGTQAVVLGTTLGANPAYVNYIRTTGDIVRAGINYKIDLFGTPAAPVVARY